MGLPTIPRIAAQHMDCQPDVREGGGNRRQPPSTTINTVCAEYSSFNYPKPERQPPKLDTLSNLSLPTQYMSSRQMLSPTRPCLRFPASPHRRRSHCNPTPHPLSGGTMMNWEHLSPHEKQTRRQSRDTLPLGPGIRRGVVDRIQSRQVRPKLERCCRQMISTDHI